MKGHSVKIYKLISSDSLITVYSCIVRETSTVCVCVRACVQLHHTALDLKGRRSSDLYAGWIKLRLCIEHVFDSDVDLLIPAPINDVVSTTETI